MITFSRGGRKPLFLADKNKTEETKSSTHISVHIPATKICKKNPDPKNLNKNLNYIKIISKNLSTYAMNKSRQF